MLTMTPAAIPPVALFSELRASIDQHDAERAARMRAILRQPKRQHRLLKPAYPAWLKPSFAPKHAHQRISQAQRTKLLAMPLSKRGVYHLPDRPVVPPHPGKLPLTEGDMERLIADHRAGLPDR